MIFVLHWWKRLELGSPSLHLHQDTVLYIKRRRRRPRWRRASQDPEIPLCCWGGDRDGNCAYAMWIWSTSWCCSTNQTRIREGSEKSKVFEDSDRTLPELRADLRTMPNDQTSLLMYWKDWHGNHRVPQFLKPTLPKPVHCKAGFPAQTWESSFAAPRATCTSTALLAPIYAWLLATRCYAGCVFRL